MQGHEKNSYKEFDNENKMLRIENSPLPHNFFLMVRPLPGRTRKETVSRYVYILYALFNKKQ